MRKTSGRRRPRQVEKPAKKIVQIRPNEDAGKVSARVYGQVSKGENVGDQKTTGGRSLLTACNYDLNRLGGWKPDESSYSVHNPASLHFIRSPSEGTLPEAVESGRLILHEAWITGEYRRARFPDEPEEPEPPEVDLPPPDPEPLPEYDLPSRTDDSEEIPPWRRMVWPQHNLPDDKQSQKKPRKGKNK